ncbi:MAG: TatD family hydrolase [Candidatus Sungbacteria bacterium]|nr:TatD family hydrolase [bacterium]MDZ4260353.1 TatD family hydrolase [Candidatus Sungbacteria bacterium]
MSTPILFDVHTHIQFSAFAQDHDAVIGRARNTGIWMINVGTQRDTSRDAIVMAERFEDGVYATIGLHPIHTQKSFHDPKELGADDKGFTSRGEEFDPVYYRELGMHPKVVAIGECGLDYYRLESDTKEIQTSAFVAQMALSHEIKKPLMIHCRNAFMDLIDVLGAEHDLLNQPPGLIHFFSGTKDNARVLLDMGFSFSFGGVLTFTRDYDDALSFIPLDRILLETDAPYVTPVPHRGTRNEPAYITEVAKKMAELKRVSFEAVAAVTTQNARNLFRV